MASAGKWGSRMVGEEKNETRDTRKTGSSKIKLIIVVIAALIVVVAGGYGVGKLVVTRAMAEAPPQEEKTGPLYNAGEFTVNINGTDARRFLRASIVFELSDAEVETTLEEKKAIWQDEIVTVLSSKGLEDLVPDNRDILKKELMARLSLICGADKLKNLYFTSFLIQ